jgi:putative transposase
MDLTFNNQNARFAFGKDDRVRIDGIAYKPEQDTEVGYLMRSDCDSGKCVQFTHEELGRWGAENRIQVDRNFYLPEEARLRLAKPEVCLSALTGRTARRLDRKDCYCTAAQDLYQEGKLKYTDASILENKHILIGRVMELAPKELPQGDRTLKPSEDFGKAPSPRTLRRWLAERGEFGLKGHIDAMARRGNRTQRSSPEARALLLRVAKGYLSREKPTVTMIHEDVELAFEQRNEERVSQGLPRFPIPSRETVRRLIGSFDAFSVLVARDGEAAARKKFRPVTRGISATRPLERVEIDEWTVDVQTLLVTSGIYDLMTDEEKQSLGLYFEEEVDPRTGKTKRKKTARWTLTAGICCATRCIVGLVLSRSANPEAAVQLLHMITVNKGAWADAVGALTPWDMFGTPELIVFDGGAAFKSRRFRKAAEDLGVAWEMAINGVPETRGTCERSFLTFATDFAPRLSGHTFSNIIEKGDADPEKRAALKLDDFTFALLRWIIDIYHNSPHGGLAGETPVRAWRRLSKKYGVTPPPSADMMRLCFGREFERSLDKSGITVLGVNYQSEALQKELRLKKPKSFNVRWHPKDIGEISVQVDNAWYTVPAVDTSLKGVTAQTWLTAVRQVKSASPKSNRLNNVAVREAIKAISERNVQAMGKAGLNLEDWSDERRAREESKLLSGVEFYEPQVPTQAKGDLGREIPPSAALLGEDDADDKTPSAQARNNGASSIRIEED